MDKALLNEWATVLEGADESKHLRGAMKDAAGNMCAFGVLANHYNPNEWGVDEVGMISNMAWVNLSEDMNFVLSKIETWNDRGNMTFKEIARNLRNW